MVLFNWRDTVELKRETKGRGAFGTHLKIVEAIFSIY